MINIQDYSDWKETLSEEQVMKSYEVFGSTFQSPQIFYFGFNKVRETGFISPVSGYLRDFGNYDFFDGAGISAKGNSYLEGGIDKEKKLFKLIEFYDVLHSRGDWCIYDVDYGKNEGIYEQFREGKLFDSGKIDIVSLVNYFSLDKGLDGIGSYHVVKNGLQPKKLIEFWMDLKKEGFDVPLQYYSEEEKRILEEEEIGFEESRDDLPF